MSINFPLVITNCGLIIRLKVSRSKDTTHRKSLFFVGFPFPLVCTVIFPVPRVVRNSSVLTPTLSPTNFSLSVGPVWGPRTSSSPSPLRSWVECPSEGWGVFKKEVSFELTEVSGGHGRQINVGVPGWIGVEVEMEGVEESTE